jgi:hypothetical protein
MGMVKNFQHTDVAEALDLLLHMIKVLAEGAQPHAGDMARVSELVAEIKSSR